MTAAVGSPRASARGYYFGDSETFCSEALGPFRQRIGLRDGRDISRLPPSGGRYQMRQRRLNWHIARNVGKLTALET